MSERNLATDIRAYVEIGGTDSFSFAVSHKPYYANIPGRDLQRMIGAEIERVSKTEGSD